MRVLHCIPTLGGGGAERQCTLLSEKLASRGHEVHIAYVLPGRGNPIAIEQSGVKLHHLGASLSEDIWRAQNDPRVLWRLARLISTLNPDIVQSWNRPMDTFVGMIRVVRGLRWILSERSSGLMYADRRERLRIRLARRADMIVSNSAAGRTYWTGKVPKGVQVRVIQNMLDHEHFVANAEIAWPAEFIADRTILYVGRFSAEKNVEVMIEAMRRYVGRWDGYAILCGFGDLQEELSAQIKQWGLAARFHFAGYVERPWQWMRRCCGMISVSLCEGHPNAVSEAMAVGCPLIVSDIPMHRELIPADAAIYVPPDSPESMAVAMGRLIDDRDAARHRAERAYSVSLQWNPERIIDAYEAAYRSVEGVVGVD